MFPRDSGNNVSLVTYRLDETKAVIFVYNASPNEIDYRLDILLPRSREVHGR